MPSFFPGLIERVLRRYLLCVGLLQCKLGGLSRRLDQSPFLFCLLQCFFCQPPRFFRLFHLNLGFRERLFCRVPGFLEYGLASFELRLPEGDGLLQFLGLFPTLLGSGASFLRGSAFLFNSLQRFLSSFFSESRLAALGLYLPQNLLGRGA